MEVFSTRKLFSVCMVDLKAHRTKKDILACWVVGLVKLVDFEVWLDGKFCIV